MHERSPGAGESELQRVILMRAASAVAQLWFSLAAASAGAWTAPLIISNAGSGNEASVPRVAPGFGGKVLVTYQQKDWRVRYRERAAGGTWGAIEIVSPSGAFAVRPAVVEDGQGRPHIIYSENDSGGVLDLIDAWKEMGQWQRVKITSTTTRWDDYACIRADSAGRLHLVYVDYIDGQGGNIIYRRWDNGVWSGPTTLGATDNPYYRRPDLSVDISGNVHVTWSTTGGDKFVVNYRRYGGGGWSTTVVVGQSVNQSFVAKSRVAAVTPNNIVIVWDDGTTRYASSGDGGANWSATQDLAVLRHDNVQAAQGTAWLAGIDRSNSSRVLVANWTGAGWSSPQQVNGGEPHWKGWVDATASPDGSVHVVYDDVVDANNTHEIGYVMQASTSPTGTVSGLVRDQSGPLPGAAVTGSFGGQTATNAQGQYTLTSPIGTISVRASRPGYADVTVPNVPVAQGQNTPLADIVMTAVAPAAVTSLVLEPSNAKIRLSWRNPASLNFTGTMIRFRTDTYPTGPTDGQLAADRPGSPGGLETFDHLNVTNGRTHYYALFAHDDRPIRSYAPATTGSALPYMEIDRDRDGDVDQSDFGRFQACYSGPAIPQNDPNCAWAKLDADDDVDGNDLAIFQGCMSSAGVIASPNCAG